MDFISLFSGAGVALIGALVAAVVSLISSIRGRRQLAEDLQPETTLDQKIGLVAALSGELSRLNSEIQVAFQLQLAETERLQKEADKSKAVAGMNQEAVQAAASLASDAVETAWAKKQRPDRRFQILVALASYALGVVSTIILNAITAASAAGAS